jgi:hypothetical protein
VDFPAPFAPTNPTDSPGDTLSEISFNISAPFMYANVRFLISICLIFTPFIHTSDVLTIAGLFHIKHAADLSQLGKTQASTSGGQINMLFVSVA